MMPLPVAAVPVTGQMGKKCGQELVCILTLYVQVQTTFPIKRDTMHTVPKKFKVLLQYCISFKQARKIRNVMFSLYILSAALAWETDV